MQIFVRDYHSTFVLDVEPSDTICVLRRLICAKKQIPPDFQLLQYAGKILGLVSGNTLADDDTWPPLAEEPSADEPPAKMQRITGKEAEEKPEPSKPPGKKLRITGKQAH